MTSPPSRAMSRGFADLDRLFAAVRTGKGHIDILFANAGTAEFAALGEITDNHFNKIFDTNVKGHTLHSAKGAPS